MHAKDARLRVAWQWPYMRMVLPAGAADGSSPATLASCNFFGAGGVSAQAAQNTISRFMSLFRNVTLLHSFFPGLDL